MLNWLGFIGFTAFMFFGFVEAISEASSRSDGSYATSMGGQFMIITPVAALAPCVADCLFLNSAIIELKYGWLGAGMFVTGYLVYLVAGFILGARLADKKRLANATKTEAATTSISEE